MINFLLELLGNKFFSSVTLILASASSPEKAHPIASSVIKAPEALDLAQIQTWLHGSVWALLTLNLLALSVFLANILLPQILGFFAFLKTSFDYLRNRREKTSTTPESSVPPSPQPVVPAEKEPIQSKTSAAKQDQVATPPPKVPPSPSAPPPPTQPPTSEPAPPSPKDLAPAAPPPPETPSTNLPPSPEPQLEAPSIPSAPEPSMQTREEVTEVIEEVDLPTFSDDEPIAAETPPSPAEEIQIPEPPPPSPPSPTEAETPVPVSAANPIASPEKSVETEPKPQNEEIEPPKEPPAPPLPEAKVSGETEPAVAATSPHTDKSVDIDEALKDVLAETIDATEELSIFDPSIIDEALKEDQTK